MPRSYSKKSLAHKLRECYWCGKTGNGDEFCDLPEDDNKWACLDCDDEMINCNNCGDCPTMFYKDAVEIDGNWYCKKCAKDVEEPYTCQHSYVIQSDNGPNCCICGEKYSGFGNNAEPVYYGQCCDHCNFDLVSFVRSFTPVSKKTVEEMIERKQRKR